MLTKELKSGNLRENLERKFRHSLSNAHSSNLLRQMLTYIKKKYYHISKKVAYVGFVWHPDTLFEPSDISVGTSLSLVENTVKKILKIPFISKTIDRKSMVSSNQI